MMKSIRNCQVIPFDDVPCTSFDSFRKELAQEINTNKKRILAFFPVAENGETYRLIAVVGGADGLLCGSTTVEKEYPSLTPEIPALHWFERELHEQYGIIPREHPWLKPIRFHNEHTEPAVTDYFRMQGDAVHEVAVGPIHAGVIEPGHFRFQCMGEKVYSLEISLGYQHRGIEKMILDPASVRNLPLMETAAGDSSAAASTVYARLVEAFAGIKTPGKAEIFRQIAVELERIANHVGDLGALSGDVAYLPTASFCGRIRGDYLNLTAELCGNRFGRGINNYGGVRHSINSVLRKRIREKLTVIYKELQHALDLMFDSPTVLDRFENTGTVQNETALRIGLTGPAGRASGLDVNALRDFPCPGQSSFPEPISVAELTGDVMARAKVRYAEIKAAHKWLFQVLDSEDCEQQSSGTRVPPELCKNAFAVSITEAWRGDYCCCAVTDQNGKFRRCKIVDPSFHNWFGLAMSLRNEEISNFPICNKSFNLSYCGHDL